MVFSTVSSLFSAAVKFGFQSDIRTCMKETQSHYLDFQNEGTLGFNLDYQCIIFENAICVTQSEAFQKTFKENKDTQEETINKFEELREKCPKYVENHSDCKADCEKLMLEPITEIETKEAIPETFVSKLGGLIGAALNYGLQSDIQTCMNDTESHYLNGFKLDHQCVAFENAICITQSEAFQKTFKENKDTKEKMSKKFEELREKCPKHVEDHPDCKADCAKLEMPEM
jgi:DNA repair exonuclease SbcCD ATPase subunit